MANESPKNESAAPAQAKQESKFYASLDEHGFKLLVTFFIVLVVLCLTPPLLVVGGFLTGGTLNEQYQIIFFTTLITFFGILITGIFIFMTFRIEHGAKIEARQEARTVAEEMMEQTGRTIEALIPNEVKKQVSAEMTGKNKWGSVCIGIIVVAAILFGLWSDYNNGFSPISRDESDGSRNTSTAENSADSAAESTGSTDRGPESSVTSTHEGDSPTPAHSLPEKSKEDQTLPSPRPDSQSQPTPPSNPPPSVLPSVTIPSVESARQADGWVYVGTRAGLKWDEKYFNWDGEKDRLPEKGDILTAIGSVYLRVRLGEHAHIVGVIYPDEQVNVLRTQTVADGHHWVQVKRIQEKEQSE